MKKLLLIGILALCGLMTTGCGGYDAATIDYGCAWIYEIVNETESDIVYTCGKEVIVIKSGERERIFSYHSMCGKNTIVRDIHAPEELVSERKTVLYGKTLLLLDGEPLPDAIWRRSLWSFSNGIVYLATYTLTITNELIESLE
jgi:hypothetical protein